ncbi:MAG: hypothetical protein UX09_C0001G0049 [Candidatus Uhrbacteria bacterium GW2011_GWE2_45_35]|uniref:Uncharacterized protein n=1 Tax=Candidatus Uhrbacteria bacterium GW2011_GWE2_45_35 TaxID=1618993 RepID=A0A0G1QKS3_9BACT|nr:MAG: hypothetical protein UX09_C0001G0049 [Candidatus Uhrbacteria bacterium GW2011_GWE2_45_35]
MVFRNDSDYQIPAHGVTPVSDSSSGLTALLPPPGRHPKTPVEDSVIAVIQAPRTIKDHPLEERLNILRVILDCQFDLVPFRIKLAAALHTGSEGVCEFLVWLAHQPHLAVLRAKYRLGQFATIVSDLPESEVDAILADPKVRETIVIFHEISGRRLSLGSIPAEA